MAFIISKGGIQHANLLVVGVMWVPGIVSLLYRFFSKMGFSGVGWRSGNIKYHAIAFFAPLFVAAMAYAIAWLTDISELIQPPQEMLERNGVTSAFQLVLK